jgi:hypothetical protein
MKDEKLGVNEYRRLSDFLQGTLYVMNVVGGGV